VPNILRFVGRSCQSTEPLYGSDALSACQVSDARGGDRRQYGSREPGCVVGAAAELSRASGRTVAVGARPPA
jgi:hypothetical protein